MSFWSAIVWIITVCAIMLVMLTKYGVSAVGKGKGQPEDLRHEAQIAALQAELAQTKDRIAVLERIATENDRGLLLDREIDKLRSLPTA